MTKKQKGILLIVWPPILFVTVLTVFAISSFAITAMMAGQVETSTTGLAPASGLLTVMKILRVVLGLGGLLSIVGGPVSIIFGIYFLAKNDQPTTPGITPEPPQPKI